MTITLDELIEQACPLINDNGWAFYFVPSTAQRGEELGLDVLSFYLMGRGGVLGDVGWPVVLSAFGYFNPNLIRDGWTGGRAKIDPREAGHAYVECCKEFGRLKLSAIPGLDAFCAAAGAVNEAADVQALTLYAAAKAEPLADDLPARAMQLVAVLREFRGSAHLLAVVASGLEPKKAHYIHRPDAWTLFGWPDSEVPEITDDDRHRAVEAEALTDRLVTPAYSVLDGQGRAALLDGMQAIAAALAS